MEELTQEEKETLRRSGIAIYIQLASDDPEEAQAAQEYLAKQICGES